MWRKHGTGRVWLHPCPCGFASKTGNCLCPCCGEHIPRQYTRPKPRWTRPDRLVRYLDPRRESARLNAKRAANRATADAAKAAKPPGRAHVLPKLPTKRNLRPHGPPPPIRIIHPRRNPRYAHPDTWLDPRAEAWGWPIERAQQWVYEHPRDERRKRKG